MVTAGARMPRALAVSEAEWIRVSPAQEAAFT